MEQWLLEKTRECVLPLCVCITTRLGGFEMRIQKAECSSLLLEAAHIDVDFFLQPLLKYRKNLRSCVAMGTGVPDCPGRLRALS